MGRGSNANSESTVNLQRTEADIVMRVRALNLGEVYEVGGCVRDEILGRDPDDYDFAVVGSTFDELMSKLNKEGSVSVLTVAEQDVGVRFTSDWTGPKGIEIALARAEVSTGPGHKDFAIRPDKTVTIDQDLERRDFTCNSLARNIDTGRLHDPYGGADDIRNGILRMVHPDAFRDDPLRILRGIARCAKDGSTPDEQTAEAMKAWAARLSDGSLSADRIYGELNKAMEGEYIADALRIARDNGVLEHAIPEIAPIIGFEQRSRYHAMTCDEHTFSVVDYAAKHGASKPVIWAALLHDSGKPHVAFEGDDGRLHFYRNPDDENAMSHEEYGEKIAANALGNLLADKATLDKVCFLVGEHMFQDDSNWDKRKQSAKERRARKFIHRVGRDNVEDLLLLRLSDRSGKFEGARPEGWDTEVNDFSAVVRSQMDKPLFAKELAINGHDLMELGFKGKAIGDVQRELLLRVLAEPEHNDKERLTDWASRLVGKFT